MTTPFDFRSALAATVLLAVLAAAYGAAVRLAPLPAISAAELPLASDSTATVAAGPAYRPEPAPTTPPPTPEPARPADFRHPVFERGSPAAQRPQLLHHYVGTVGGQPATALLTWQNPDSVSGSFYLHRRGPEYSLSLPLDPDRAKPRPRRRGGQVLEVVPLAWDGPSSEWQLRGRPGATLTGTWRGGPTGRPQAVVLREDYAGAVRLEVQTWWVHGRYTVTDDYGHAHSSVDKVQYDIMHLPDPTQVPLALRPVLSPGPANCRRLLLEGGEFDCETNQKLTVQLNDFGLFSYEYEQDCSIIGGAADERYRRALLDLRAGRWLTTESQLRASYKPYLSYLMARHLLHDEFPRSRISNDTEWPQRLRPYLATEHDTLRAVACWVQEVLPPLEDALYTGAGLALDCWWGEFIEAFPRDHLTILIPYRELRPLVRPGTPLARMLRARGMW